MGGPEDSGAAGEPPTVSQSNKAAQKPMNAAQVVGDKALGPRCLPAGCTMATSTRFAWIRIDPDVFEMARASGAKWQKRVNDVLRNHFSRH